MPADLLEIEEVSEPASDLERPRTLVSLILSSGLGISRLTTLGETFKRQPRPEDWDRFNTYAPFVQNMGFMNQKNSPLMVSLVVSHRICRALAQNCQQKAILPALTSLSVATNDLPYAASFLTPRVHTLKLLAHPNHITPLSMSVAKIQHCSPNLERLQVLGTTDAWRSEQKAQLKPGLAKLLYALNLHRFSCDFLELDEELLGCLLSMSHLDAIDIQADLLTLKQSLLKRRQGESTLKAFNLSSKTHKEGTLAAVMSSLCPSKLESFRISFTSNASNPTKDEVSDFLSVVGRQCTSALIELRIFTSGTAANRPIVESSPITFDMIKCILPLSNLRTVTLSAHPLDLTDEEIKHLAISWPALQTLVFESTPLFDLPPRSSLKGLLWLVLYCRKLHYLEYRFSEASGDVILDPDDLATAANHPLRILAVGSSPLEDTQKVARFLTSVFPTLSFLSFSYPRGQSDGNSLRWAEVESLIQQR